MELTLGPILFEWKRDEVLRFYDEVAQMDIDRVYIGEVVCVKKRGVSLKDIGTIAGKLEKAGKKVTLSSLAIVSNEDELAFTRELAKLPYGIEANDMSVFNMVSVNEKGEVFAGPHITSYNAPTIEFLKSIGIRRVTFPVELSRDSVAYNIKNTGVEGEVFAHGKVPLAYSWRCYTSRAYGLSKTECRRDCAKHPDGIEIKTMEGQPLFTINGTSILSALTYTLVEFVDDIREAGVAALRISPQYKDTAKVVDIWRKRSGGRIGAEEALSALKEVSPRGFCNGWFSGGAGKDYLTRLGV